MNFNFLSFVTILNNQDDITNLTTSLREIHLILKNHFKDFEIIIINNCADKNISQRIYEFDSEVKKEIYLIHLSKVTDPNNAVLAGLDQANGDYIAIYESQFFSTPSLILDLYEKSQEGYDMVYVRSSRLPAGISQKLAIKIFSKIINSRSSLSLDPLAFDSRIISRRAINAIVKHRENIRYMKVIYSLVGYNSNFVTVNNRLEQQISFMDQLKLYINAITSFTDFLQLILRWIFLLSILLFLGATTNAVLVKCIGQDIFGQPQQGVSGWAFLVILVSMTFSIICLILYIMSLYLENIYREIKQRPLYIIESIKRF